ncbi:hypothetical protein HanIR_Chr08g0377981 [Helianthus annuus]|nr:hypothetical protein HanIR_Chr08g0377981 [Helianthus annuus]
MNEPEIIKGLKEVIIGMKAGAKKKKTKKKYHQGMMMSNWCVSSVHICNTQKRKLHD